MERKNQEPKVSVIVPMYKCESFAEDCLDMICGQSFSDTEIICVLDGPDARLREIVESKQKEDDRIILIEQDHAGAGVARNTGMDQARGDYLLFLDADDLYQKTLIERLYYEAVEYDADIAMCSYTQTNDWLNTVERGIGFNYSVFPEKELIDPSKIKNLYKSFIGAAWNKLFRHKMVVDNDLRFSKTMVMNDELFVLTAMTISRRLVTIKEELIEIRRYVNEDSISSHRAEYSDETLIVLKELYQWMRKNGYWDKRKSDYYTKFNDTLIYQSSYDRNEKYIDGMARTLATEEPWKQMTNAEMNKALILDAKKLKKNRDTLSDEMRLLNDKDNAGRNQQFHMMNNRIKALEEIRSLMKSKYSRDLDKRDNPLKLFGWLVRTEGLRKTMKIMRQTYRKAQVLKPRGVLCAGHLTTRCGYITFFLPVNVERDNAEIEDLSIVVRCNGYYPRAISGYYDGILTPLGPKSVAIISGGTPTRKNEIGGVTATVIPGFGIRFQIRFVTALVRNDNRDKAHNNHPVSVMMTGKIRLNYSGVN